MGVAGTGTYSGLSFAYLVVDRDTQSIIKRLKQIYTYIYTYIYVVQNIYKYIFLYKYIYIGCPEVILPCYEKRDIY